MPAAMLDHVADTPPAPANSGVSIPGEPEAALYRIGGRLGLDVAGLLAG
ncbi:hypothetical protein [Azospirillum thiophilum]|nr:hypothetical protein [Azospirillum thiophilum]